jgi:hypothetical protein
MITFLLPGMPIISAKAYSSDSVDKWGRKANATAQDTINAISGGIGGLQMGISGSNPLVPLSPPIQTNLDLTDQETASQVCYSGSLYGNQFPDAEVFVLNSQGQSKMLLTFTTPGSPTSGQLKLIGNDGTGNMGSFSNVCMAK